MHRVIPNEYDIGTKMNGINPCSISCIMFIVAKLASIKIVDPENQLAA